jgi:hypothetical protein
MMGVFVQINSGRPKAASCLVGYLLQESGCWDWVGSLSPEGYGRFRVNGRPEYAHRIMFERHKGPIPAGREIDHLCRNRRCVNPDHLEAVSRRENCLRGTSPPAIGARRTHCPQGHELSGDNLARAALKRGGRNCRECARLRARDARERERGDRP